jgi:hypothetical protein
MTRTIVPVGGTSTFDGSSNGTSISLMPPTYYSWETRLNAQVAQGARVSMNSISLEIYVEVTALVECLAAVLLVRRNPTGITGASAVSPASMEQLLYLLAGSSDQYAAHIMNLKALERRVTDTVYSARLTGNLQIPQKWRDEIGILASDEDDAEATPIRSQLLLVSLSGTNHANATWLQASGYVDLRYTTGKQSSYAFQSLLEGVD